MRTIFCTIWFFICSSILYSGTLDENESLQFISKTFGSQLAMTNLYHQIENDRNLNIDFGLVVTNGSVF